MTPKQLRALARAMREEGVSRLQLAGKLGPTVIEVQGAPPPAPPPRTPRPRPTEGLRREAAVPPELAASGLSPEAYAEAIARGNALLPD